MESLARNVTILSILCHMSSATIFFISVNEFSCATKTKPFQGVQVCWLSLEFVQKLQIKWFSLIQVQGCFENRVSLVSQGTTYKKHESFHITYGNFQGKKSFVTSRCTVVHFHQNVSIKITCFSQKDNCNPSTVQSRAS